MVVIVIVFRFLLVDIPIPQIYLSLVKNNGRWRHPGGRLYQRRLA